jgi:hypothetical protein
MRLPMNSLSQHGQTPMPGIRGKVKASLNRIISSSLMLGIHQVRLLD